MKSKLISCMVLLGLSPFLVQCVISEEEFRGLDLRTKTLNSRVAELEQHSEIVRNQAAIQARMGSEIQGVNSRLLQQQAQLDETQQRQNKLQEQNLETIRNLSLRLDNIDSNLRETTARIELINRKLTTSIGELQAKQEENRQQLLEIQERRAREAAERVETAKIAARAAEQARQEAEERARQELERQAQEAEEHARQEPKHQAQEATAASPTHRGPREIVAQQFKQKFSGAQTTPPPTASAPSRPSPPVVAVAPTTPAPVAPVVPVTPVPPPTPRADGPSIAHYNQGVEYLRQNNPQRAHAAFARYLELAPRGEMAGNARYLLAESLYQQQQYELAILEFQRVITGFTGHAKIPAALLHQAMAFEKLGEASTAIIVYQRLVNEFPKSAETQKAEERLRKIR